MKVQILEDHIPLKDLFEEDRAAWTDRMIDLLEEGKLNEIDYTNLQVYLIDNLDYGNSGIFMQMVRLITHMLKWKFQPEKRTRSWSNTMADAQEEVLANFRKPRLERKGSWKRSAREDFADAYQQARRKAARETGLDMHTFPAESEFTFDDLLDTEFTYE